MYNIHTWFSTKEIGLLRTTTSFLRLLLLFYTPTKTRYTLYCAIIEVRSAIGFQTNRQTHRLCVRGGWYT